MNCTVDLMLPLFVLLLVSLKAIISTLALVQDLLERHMRCGLGGKMGGNSL